MYKVFIDGAEGTTGLKIHEYFQRRDDIELIHIDETKRKILEERLACVKKADVSFLCLPDGAARELASEAPADCRILDTSTAHRTDESWVYGMPELLPGQREKIRNSNRVAVPGCHATGVILLIKPLLEAGVISPDYPFSATSITGYSGGGKKMIARYESEDRIKDRQGPKDARSQEKQDPLKSPRQYGITQSHKHLPEIMAATGIGSPPAFMPVVADYYSGMEVTIPIKGSMMKGIGGSPREAALKILKERYADQSLVKVVEEMDESGFIAANRLAGTNRLEISVSGSDENILLMATYDNLGKGASGAAIQNMNIMLGIEETKGLI
ncbi:MAG: N-acetyl-gamma-glutamyl-phosphate reductase [Bacillota bacterium]|nr:N-acetyl-gamma-glutamyl-phosphate reductase [Bacillota bacterium]